MDTSKQAEKTNYLKIDTENGVLSLDGVQLKRVTNYSLRGVSRDIATLTLEIDVITKKEQL